VYEIYSVLLYNLLITIQFSVQRHKYIHSITQKNGANKTISHTSA